MKCPKCDDVLMPGATKCRSCGWEKGGEQSTSKPAPNYDSLVHEILNILRVANISDPESKVRKFIDLLEPEKRNESAREVQVVGGGTRWVWPYEVRVKQCLLKYLQLDDDDKRVIQRARNDGIFWRGDDMAFFNDVIIETMRMREIGVESYRAQCVEKMKALKIGG